MLSDDSSSDSETGRFKSHTPKNTNESSHNSRRKDSTYKSLDKNRQFENNRYRRESDKRDDRSQRYRRSTERHRSSRRYSPVRRRQYSRDRSADRRRKSNERFNNPRGSREKSRTIDSSYKKGRRNNSAERKRNFKDEIRRDIVSNVARKDEVKKGSSNSCVSIKTSNTPKQTSPSPKKKCHTKQSESETELSNEEPPASYYNMIPSINKKSRKESLSQSITDSSDDEKLRAKLLNLEKELEETKKKKHKKKHKKKISKSKDKEVDISMSVEVTSTTDIKGKVSPGNNTPVENTEVTSTQQKTNEKESSEEGEIMSDDEPQIAHFEVDPNDLRHKLKHSGVKADTSGSPDLRGKLKLKKSTSPTVPSSKISQARRKIKHIGPTIDPAIRQVLAESDHIEIINESSDEDVGIGPLPAGAEHKWSEAHERLEERALDIKIKNIDGQVIRSSEPKSREKWMLELPEGKAKLLGIEARSFKMRQGPDMSDRSCWTDTPERKALKAAGVVVEDNDQNAALKKEAHAKLIAKRDAEQEKAAKKHKKKHKRDESLLEMHEKKLKKKKKKEEKVSDKTERRPFSRDLDLQVNRFDEAQKKSIIKKAQNLDSRFSSGEAKYL